MRALISVSDKNGLIPFATSLQQLGVEIISTGGTQKALQEAGIPVTGISEVTGFPECLDGRVKTLTPQIHAGILAVRNNEEHMKQLKKLDIQPIDIVAVNLYPFKETILKENVTWEDAIENIDIGGPTMLRAAAKNHEHVCVITDPSDYGKVIEELTQNKGISLRTKQLLAAKVFSHTAHYDALIADYLNKQLDQPLLRDTLTVTYEKAFDMRYGENPHQKAAFYREINSQEGSLSNLTQLHGKELSFNNINDTHGALELLREFSEPTIVACKHSNPCGVGSGQTIYDAYLKAHQTDPVSIYGGIIVSNREIDLNTANELNKIFVEIVLAPSFTPDALRILKQKKNIRLLTLPNLMEKQSRHALDFKKVSGGLLVQDVNNELLVKPPYPVTKKEPNRQQMNDLIFAWKVVKHVKSNAIAIGKNEQSIGIGTGQVSRIWACKQAIEHGGQHLGREALKGACLASDAYFPFPDCVEAAAKAGITAIIQPGGSVNDELSIKKCDELGIAMVFTDIRHFRH